MEGENPKIKQALEPKMPNNYSGRVPITPMDLPSDISVEPKEVDKRKIVDKQSNISTDSIQDVLDTKLSKRVPIVRKVSNWIWWVLGVFSLILIAGTVYYVFSLVSFNRATVEFNFNPGGVVLELDDDKQENVNSISIKVTAGEHIAVATKEGYLYWEKEFSLLPGEEAKFNIELRPIPAVNVIADVNTDNIDLIRKDELIAYFDKSTGNLKAYNLLSNEVIPLFSDNYVFSSIEKVIWGPNDVMAIVKIADVWKLNNMFNNTDAKGMYIPLGGTPKQSPALRNGIATWLFDSSRQNTRGFQPILLNESIRDIAFSPGGNEIMYFYEAANGEKSLIRAENVNGSDWLRIETDVLAKDPSLVWLLDDQYLLLLDDVGYLDRVFDINNRKFKNIMPERVENTSVIGSPDGNKLLYLQNSSVGVRLAVWDILKETAIYAFDQEVVSYTWQSNDVVIVALPNNVFLYWHLGDKIRPVQFSSSIGDFNPKQMVYSNLNKQLYLFDGNRIIYFEVN